MPSSLSIVLVAHNRETPLTADILHLLEIAGDLSSFVEILIVDDGSTDETYAVARDLARRFPQVYVHHNAMRYGNAAAMQTAMRETTGEYVFFCTEMPQVTQIQQLWSIRQSPRFVMGHPAQTVDQDGVLRLIHRPAIVSQGFARSDAAEKWGPRPIEVRTETCAGPKRKRSTAVTRRQIVAD